MQELMHTIRSKEEWTNVIANIHQWTCNRMRRMYY